MDLIKVPVDKLLLDPNNYRLRGEQNYKYVEEKSVNNVMVQKRVRNQFRLLIISPLFYAADMP